jgi:arylsulfatase A-like enzyme
MKGLLVVAAALCCAGLESRAQPGAAPRTHLVIVVDGLRPDYVTAETMPRLYRLGQRGTLFRAHHSVFPTVTRVNGSSLVTGAYADRHGLMGNVLYSPGVDPGRGLDTGERANLEAVERAEGRLLTAPTLSEMLARAGKTLLAISSGSSGSGYVLNSTAASGGIIHPEYVIPPALASRVTAALGPSPPHATPNEARDDYAIDAYLKLGLGDLHADVTFLWLNDPDGTAHATGIGSELTTKSLVLVDAGIGRIEDALQARGLLDGVNIIVTSDHGFSTHTRELMLPALVEPFARTMPDGSKDIVVSEGAIYLRSGVDVARVSAIVAALQERPEVGAIFTRPRPAGGSEGSVPGTLSYDAVHWNHPRAGEILVSSNWTADMNASGFAGTTTDPGVAGHGSTSPYDIHNTLIAAGPDFRKHAVSDVPTANVDIAPTLLRLLGLPAAPSMAGRIISEGLGDGPAIETIAVERLQETVSTPDGRYQLTAYLSKAAGHTYLDFTEVKRSAIRR